MIKNKKRWIENLLKFIFALYACFTLNCSGGDSDSTNNQVVNDSGFYQDMVINKILGGEESDESLASITVDEQGNFYLLGNIYRSAGQSSDILIAKIDTKGLLTWGRIWSADTKDTSTSITYDGKAYLYATGLVEEEPYLDVSALILKIDASDGAIVWEKLLIPTDGWHSSFARAIDLDSDSIFVAGTYGYVDDPDQPEDIYFISYLLNLSADGEIIWQSLFNLEYCYLNPADCTEDDLSTQANALKVDGAGHVYVAGNTEGRNFLLKFSMEELGPLHAWWMGVLVGESSNKGSSANALALDVSNVYVSIPTTDRSPRNQYIRVAKIDENGNSKWVRSYAQDLPGQDSSPTALETHQGNILVGGIMEYGDQDDPLLLEIGEDGIYNWAARYVMENNRDEIGAMRVVGLKGFGDVFCVAGNTITSEGYDDYHYSGSWSENEDLMDEVDWDNVPTGPWWRVELHNDEWGTLVDAAGHRNYENLPETVTFTDASEKISNAASNQDIFFMVFEVENEL